MRSPRPAFAPRCRLANMKRTFLALACLLLPVAVTAQSFTVSFPKELNAQALDGRLLLCLSTDPSAEPRKQIDDTPRSQIVFGMTVDGWKPGQVAVVDATAWGYPIRSLKDVPEGEYTVQVVLNRYETFNRADGKTIKLHMDQGEGQQWSISPGNLISKPVKITLKRGGAPIALSLSEAIPPIPAPADTKYLRHIRIQSALLTKFWGRPMFLSAIVLVPAGFDEHPQRALPADDLSRSFSRGFRRLSHHAARPESEARLQRALSSGGLQPHRAGGELQVLSAMDLRGISAFSDRQIQHANPYYDDSYAVNSANVGPYGDAIETELIPAIESSFAGSGQGWARFTYGGSTGGWEALAVQVFYPEHYNGAFCRLPGPDRLSRLHEYRHLQRQERLLLEGAHKRVRSRRCATTWATSARPPRRSTATSWRWATMAVPASSTTSGRRSSGPRARTAIRSQSVGQDQRRDRSQRGRVLARALRPGSDQLERDWATLGPESGKDAHLCGLRRHVFSERRRVSDGRFSQATARIPPMAAKWPTARAPSTAGTAIPRSPMPIQPAALQHHVPAQDSEAHREDRARRSGSEELAVLMGPGASIHCETNFRLTHAH
jgi:hypothetical protein